MNDCDLKILNRNHDVEKALKSMEKATAKMSGHKYSLSADLIFGRPGQTLIGKFSPIYVLKITFGIKI